ncbi:unnamed protein product [Thlaspi arvense]|uniref:pyruvate decarboxylase n=1 Tax=Thlaspi arvense TaxID=13288 RepID=A0AAU9RI97_THLAR|nr:unnamed protein product [Thlaspi arvense]
MFQHIQKMLSSETAVIAETGDSWFNCQKLKLPKGCGYEFQMQYGSIGWSVGATLGYAQAVPEKRVLAFIGDGSFQVTAQDISTMLRNGQKTIIFLINNGGYTIEVEIHDGPYNVIKNWNYTGLVDAIHNGEGKCWTTKVRYEEELVEAIKTATSEKKDCLCFIEVIVHKDDTETIMLHGPSYSADMLLSHLNIRDDTLKINVLNCHTLLHLGANVGGKCQDCPLSGLNESIGSPLVNETMKVNSL